MQSFDGMVVVERVLSQLERGCIFSGVSDGGEALRVRFAGAETQPLPGDAFHITGLIGTFRDRFGRSVTQVDTRRMRRVPARGMLIGPWLERLPNIGSTRAARLVAAFGPQISTVLATPSRLPEVAAVLEPGKPALAAKIAAQVYAAVVVHAGADALKAAEVDFLVYLEGLGVRETKVAAQLWRFVAGPDAIERLRRNPYLVASLVDWRLADRVGRRLLREQDPKGDLVNHPARLRGALDSAWREVLAEGDTAATEERIADLLKARKVSAQAALLLADEVGQLRRAGDLLRAPGAAWLEDQIACALWAMENRESTVAVPNNEYAVLRLVIDAECKVGITLSDEQRRAVACLLTLPVSALQGGAGVGKTTVMKVLALAWENLGGDVVLGALAGKAALQLARDASTHWQPRLAYTVARLISMLERQCAQEERPEKIRPASDVDFTPRTLLIIDEAGMLDTPSLQKLLSLLPEGARILLAGDHGQLPPVGIGKVFHDLVNEGSRVASLTEVRRQASGSVIPAIAAQVRDGVAPQLAAWSGERSGVYLVAKDDLLAVQRRLRAEGGIMVIAALKSTVSFVNENEFSYRHPAGTPVRRLGPMASIGVNDPVVMTSNRYKDGLFNGLLGVIRAIDGEEVMVLWDSESTPRALPKEAEADLELAYAITCHKAQGTASVTVVVAVDQSRLVTREWLYTAITRGRELVLIVGQQEDVDRAVERRTIRTTGFILGQRCAA